MEDARQLVERYGDMVWRLALARTGRQQDAEDVFQEVFLRAVRSADRLQSEEHARAWLLRCTVNCTKSLFASAWRRNTVPLKDDLLAPMEEEQREVYTAVLALPQPYRTAIHLHYYEGMTVAELAALTGRREGTVKSWLHRGRALLKGALDDEV